MLIARNVSKIVQKRLELSPVVLLAGARQTGKSTLVKSLIGKRYRAQYVTFDDAKFLAAALSAPQDFVESLSLPVVLDEVQLVPEIFRPIKLVVDRDRRPGMFLLTGSANVLLLPRLSESLAGRIQILQLWPFSQGESDGRRENFLAWLFDAKPTQKYLERIDANKLADRIIRGGYPEVHSMSNVQEQAAWFGAYITTIMQRDIRDLAQIEKLSAMPNLLALLAHRVGGLLNASDLSSATGLPLSTLNRYLSLLEAIFLIVPFRAWAPNRSKRFIKSRKLYLCDTGLASNLLGLTKGNWQSRRVEFGHLLENFVALELIKQMSWYERALEIFHFRTDKGIEVDLVLDDPELGVVGLEIKLAGVVRSDDLKGLKLLQSVAGDRFKRGVVLYLGEQVYPLGENIWAVPISGLWLM